MEPEPEIIINGNKLTDGQSMATRAALCSFHQELMINGLGDGLHGKTMKSAYLERISEILDIISR